VTITYAWKVTNLYRLRRITTSLFMWWLFMPVWLIGHYFILKWI